MKTTCGILLIDNAQRILICHPTRHHPNQWDIVKGCGECGETYTETMFREFKEETSVDLNDICSYIIEYSAMHNIEWEYKFKLKKLHGFIGVINGNTPYHKLDIANFKCESMVKSYHIPFPEVDAFAWIDICDMNLLHETQQRFIQHVMKHSNYLCDAVRYNQPKSHFYG